MKVLIIVTHLLGTGHLTRMLTLARAFGAAGHHTVVVSGGVPPAHLDTSGVDLVQLPPVRSNGVDFSLLLNQDGTPVTPQTMAHREAILLETLRTSAPDVLITELFPFGRRILKSEFLALLTAAQEIGTRMFASVRDILAPPSKPAKQAFAEDALDRYYDGILVHADPGLTPLDLSWPVTDRIADKLHYTGYVCPSPALPHPEGAGTGEVLVSAGGGDVGDALFDTARAAARLDPSRRWRLLVGGQAAGDRCLRLMADAPANLVAEPARADFRQLLHHADASVSLCGYNTALDVLQTNLAAVFVPFDAGGEVEQRLRAEALSAQPGIEMVLGGDLTPERLCTAIATAQSAPRNPITPKMTRGAARSVEIVAEITEALDAR